MFSYNHVDKQELAEEFNEVSGITTICRSTLDPIRGDHPELEVGKEYEVTHAGVLRSCSYIILKDHSNRKYGTELFDIYENGRPLSCDEFCREGRFLAPYLRRMYRTGERYVSKVEEDAIPRALDENENAYGIKILYAAEYGSRAYGLETPDSDWDVRFIFDKGSSGKDVIEKVIIEELYLGEIDAVGWSIDYARVLHGQGNMLLHELMNSPKVYRCDKGFAEQMRKDLAGSLDPDTAIRHYLLTCVKPNEGHIDYNFNEKCFVHYLRGLLACIWIEKNGTVPPFDFKALLNATVEDPKIWAKIKTGSYHDRRLVDFMTGTAGDFMSRYMTESQSE